MTNEEEKILEEEDITLEDAAEEAEELQEETQDEGRAIERREDADLEGILERQVLRDGGLRDADPNMIQTHLDNFLAKIAGETPVDDNPRNSKEYWLNKIADWIAGKSTDDASTKKLYWHGITVYKSTTPYNQNIRGFIISTDPAPIDTITKLVSWFENTPGSVVDLAVNGVTTLGSETPATAQTMVLRRINNAYRLLRIANDQIVDVGITSIATLFDSISDAVNALN